MFKKRIQQLHIIDDKYLSKLVSYDKTCTCLWNQPIIVRIVDIKKKPNSDHYEFLVQGENGKTTINLIVLSQNHKRVTYDIEHDLIKPNQLIQLNDFVATKISHDDNEYVIVTLANFEYILI